MRCPRASVLLPAALLAACGSSTTEQMNPGGDNNGLLPVPDADKGFQFSAGLDVEPGGEKLHCLYVQLPKGAHNVTGLEHVYTAGAHHIAVNTTKLTAITQTSLFDCIEENGWTDNVTGTVYVAQNPTGGFNMPEGVQMSFADGAVLLIQIHFQNPTLKVLRGEIAVNMFYGDPAKKTQEAGVLFYTNLFIYLPAMGRASAIGRCPIAEDISVLTSHSHMHRSGVKFNAHVMEDDKIKLYETDKWVDTPLELFSPPVQLKKGQTIEFRCDYVSDRPNDVYYGLSVTKNEMCGYAAVYWPRYDFDNENCVTGHFIGTGTKACKDTVGCFIGCGSVGNRSCIAKCIHESAEWGTAAATDVARCATGECIGPCGTGQTLDAPACAQCMAQVPACAKPFETCSNPP